MIKKNNAMMKIFKILALIFSLNFIWEISQMFLYQDHSDGFWNFIYVHIKASLGDVIIFLIIYASGILLFKNKNWFFSKSKATYIFAALSGFIIAMIIEKYALATNRWQYNELMPIIPILKVGLSPILQMIILPIITITFILKIAEKNKSYSL